MKPNILFILADDMGYGDFGCLNYGASETPCLDALMKEGVGLTQHYSASALCAPARAALMTGRYPHRTGVIDTIAAGEMDCLPTLCSAAGVAVPEGLALDGQDVLPALRGDGSALLNPRRFWQWSRGVPTITHNAAMRDGFWKLVVPGDARANSFEGWRQDLKISQDIRANPENYLDGVPDATGRPIHLNEPAAPPLLFNLASDPLEQQNVADVNPDRVSRMMRELEKWFEDVESDRRSIPDRQLRCASEMRRL